MLRSTRQMYQDGTWLFTGAFSSILVRPTSADVTITEMLLPE